MSKITKRFVESIVPDPEKIVNYWDPGLKGFGVMVLPSGRKTYCLKYRNAQRVQKRLKIGNHGPFSTEEARNLAQKHLRGIALRDDPVAKKKDNKELPLMKELAEDYLERYAPRKRSRSVIEDKKLLNNIILPFLGNEHVSLLSRRTVESLHLKLASTPYQANRVLSLLSKMISLAVTGGVERG